MPYFTVFDKEKNDSLLGELNQRFATFTPPPESPSSEVSGEAQTIWSKVCAVCHGEHGEISEFGSSLSPAPPDLRKMQFSQKRAAEVVRDGYPGTVMQPYSDLSQKLRGELVQQLASSFYGQDAERQ